MTASIRSLEMSEAFGRWMKRRTPPSSFAGDEQAEDDERASLLAALARFAPQQDVARWVDAVTSLIEGRSKFRVWPTAGEIAEACQEVNASGRGRASNPSMPIQRGDKLKLSHDQLFLLENTILPTARRWVQNYPGLAHHGRQTLEYWGEIV